MTPGWCHRNSKVFIGVIRSFLMEDIDLQASLRCLNASLRRMRDLLAWGQLKHSEMRPGQPPSFQIYDPTATDLRNEYSFFVSNSLQMHAVLTYSTTRHRRDILCGVEDGHGG